MLGVVWGKVQYWIIYFFNQLFGHTILVLTWTDKIKYIVGFTIPKWWNFEWVRKLQQQIWMRRGSNYTSQQMFIACQDNLQRGNKGCTWWVFIQTVRSSCHPQMTASLLHILSKICLFFQDLLRREVYRDDSDMPRLKWEETMQTVLNRWQQSS